MKVYFLHLTATVQRDTNVRVHHHHVAPIHDVSNDDTAPGLATMIRVIAPIMEAALAEEVGSLPYDREWRIDSVYIPERKGGRQPKDTAATVFRLGNK